MANDAKNAWRKTIRRHLQGSIGKAFAAKSKSGEYSAEDLVDELMRETNDVQTIVGFWEDTIRFFVHEEIRRRSQIEIKSNVGLWTQEYLDEGLIALGDGHVVSYHDATLIHWKQKEQNQTDVIDSTTARREATREIISAIEPEMLKRPDLTTGEWWREHGYGASQSHAAD